MKYVTSAFSFLLSRTNTTYALHCMHTKMFVYMHACMHACYMHACQAACTHKYAHTSKCMYTRIHACRPIRPHACCPKPCSNARASACSLFFAVELLHSGPSRCMMRTEETGRTRTQGIWCLFPVLLSVCGLSRPCTGLGLAPLLLLP